MQRRPSVCGPSRRRWVGLLLAGSACPALCARAASADDGMALPSPLSETLSDAAIKAGYLVKFIGFVEWPVHTLPPNAPFLIGVADADDVFGELLRLLPGRTVNGRPVVARRLDDGNTGDGFHLAFFGGGATRRRVNRLRELSVLVVTDQPGGLDSGSALNFVQADGKVRFEASLGAADQAGLRLSSRLLAVADRVLARP